MFIKTNFFDVNIHNLGNSNFLHVINIKNVDTKLSSIIDKNISRICYGENETDISIIKKELIIFFKGKQGDNRIIMGAIAEFFIHLYLNEIGFRQEFAFLNLEEGSMKKGFDGLFSYDNEIWLFESKSGSSDTNNISHHSLVSKSYHDIKKKISTKNNNNPWKNAFGHAKYVGSSDNILKDIKKLSDDYINEKYQEIKNHNLIPGSTIFVNGIWNKINEIELLPKIKTFFENKEYNGLNVVCVNNKTTDTFINYINK